MDESSRWLSSEEPGVVLALWRVMDAHFPTTWARTLDAALADPQMAPALRALSDAELEQQAEQSRASLARGFVEGDWAPYEAFLAGQARVYAKLGVGFASWFRTVGVVAEETAAQLVHAYPPPQSEAALRVLNHFLERVLSTLGTEYVQAKEKALRRSERQLRALTARLQRTREEERTAVAREIHDELGQRLTSLKLDIGWLQRRTGDPGARDAVEARLREMGALVDATLQTVRNLATQLRPGVLDHLGLEAALEWQARDFGVRTGVETHIELPQAPLPLDGEQATALFRCFQELLTNVARHAGATRVRARLWREGGELLLRVEDDGRGITPEEAEGTGSLGLLGLRERAALLGGTLEFEPVPGRGTVARVRLPLARPEADR